MIFIVTYAEKPIEECHEFLELVMKLEFFFFSWEVTHLPLCAYGYYTSPLKPYRLVIKPYRYAFHTIFRLNGLIFQNSMF